MVGASLLFNPVRHIPTSLEEWIRYPHPTVTNLLAQGYAGDLVARTDNTTVAFMPASPDWLILEYEEMIEFIASIPPLLTLWTGRAGHLADRLDDMLRGIEKQIERGEYPIDQLQNHEMEIRSLESDIRGQLAFLHSPALCLTLAQRQFLDNLWGAAGLPALERELEKRLTLLADRQGRIAAMVSSIDERNRRKELDKQRKRTETLTFVLGVVTVLGLSQLLSWINPAFGLSVPLWAWGGEGVVLVAALFSYFFFVYRKSR